LEPIRAEAIDDRLHAERVGPDRSRRVFMANIDELPDGVFVSLDDSGRGACLIRGDDLFAWSPGGYTGRRPRPRGEQVSVLTPRSTVAVIRSGYVPEVHHSAGRPRAPDRPEAGGMRIHEVGW
jgi:hypothetical protein